MKNESSVSPWVKFKMVKVGTRSYMSWTDNRPIPVRHNDIICIFESIRARSIADPLLTLFEFFEQPKVSWHWTNFHQRQKYPMARWHPALPFAIEKALLIVKALAVSKGESRAAVPPEANNTSQPHPLQPVRSNFALCRDPRYLRL